MNNYIVYKHTSPSGKVYIGITSVDVRKRWKNGKGYELCTAFNRAIIKYGWENIKHEILLCGLSKEEAMAKEQEIIKEYNSTDPDCGYNLTSGGEHYEPNDEWRERLSKSLKKYYQEHPEAREKIGEDNRNRKASEEQKKKTSDALRRYFAEHPEEREKRGRSFRGKKRGDEFSRKLGERKSKAVICVNTGKRYKSLKEASEDLNIIRSGITNVLRGRAKTCKGYKFVYAEVGDDS